jgi:ergothioneine biosynthesis protein EgtB
MTPVTTRTKTSPLSEEFSRVRRQTEDLCLPLSPEDMMVQSCAEASPAKWHLAHTTWFFETFLLREFLPGYREFHPDFRWLFNSYYNSVSDQPDKKLRASFSRPPVEAIFQYRQHVQEGIQRLLASNPPEEATRRIVLGLHHEQQHQELLAYDIKHALWTNPLRPPYLNEPVVFDAPPLSKPDWIEYQVGVCEIGYAGDEFAFDNESPRHPEYLRPYALASRLVSCGEYLAFIEDGGYRRPELWLSAGWDTVKAEGWKAPLYWRQQDGAWLVYTLYGELPLTKLLQTPVCHVSYYEADAFAHWAGKRLPTEAEWEIAADRELPGGRDAPSRGPGRGAREGSGADVWGCVGVDPECLPRLSGLRCGARCSRRIQRQIYEQPDGAAWWIGGHAGFPYTFHVPELFLSCDALAVFRHSFGEHLTLAI